MALRVQDGADIASIYDAAAPNTDCDAETGFAIDSSSADTVIFHFTTKPTCGAGGLFDVEDGLYRAFTVRKKKRKKN